MYNKIVVPKDINFHEALTRISEAGVKTLIILNKNKTIFGVITEGTIRKQILKQKLLSTQISSFINKKFMYLIQDSFDEKKVTELFYKYKYEILPIVNKKGQFIDYLEWSDFIGKKIVNTESRNIPIVFMSGGKGLRMKPFSVTIPKPLIPFKDSTIIETLIDHFNQNQFFHFYFVLNYKSNILKSYLNSIKKKNTFRYVIEKNELGTAGGLYYLKNENFEYFIISNCDTHLKIDINELLLYHKSKKNTLTIVAATKEFQLPYGVLNVNKNGTFKSITEKPKTEILTNTGLYIISKKFLSILKTPKKLDMNELIIIAKKKKMKVGLFPVSDNVWFDFGQWTEYERTYKKL